MGGWRAGGPRRPGVAAALLVSAAVLSGCAAGPTSDGPTSGGASAAPTPPSGECSFAPGAPNPCADAAPSVGVAPVLDGDWLGLYQSGATSGVRERTAGLGQSRQLSVGDGGGYLDVTGPARLASVSTANGELTPASGEELMAVGLALIGAEPSPPLTSIVLTAGGRTVTVPVGTPFPRSWQRLGGPIEYGLRFNTHRDPGELRVLFTVPAGTRTMTIDTGGGARQLELP